MARSSSTGRSFAPSGAQVVGVKYFTARVTAPHQTVERQAIYLQALERHGGVEIIEGSMEQRELICPHCFQRFKRSQEKHTDVNIAAAMLTDAFNDRMDSVVLLSGDADLVPAIRIVRGDFAKRILVVDPPRRHSAALASLAGAHLVRTRPHGTIAVNTAAPR